MRRSEFVWCIKHLEKCNFSLFMTIKNLNKQGPDLRYLRWAIWRGGDFLAWTHFVELNISRDNSFGFELLDAFLLIKTRWQKMKKPSRFFQANFLRLFWPPNGLRGHIWPHHEQSMTFADYVDMFSEVRMACLAFL